VKTLAGYLPSKKWAAVDPGALVSALVVALGYYLATRLGFAFTLEPYPISVLWPANALLLSALLMLAPRRWWIVVVAALPAHLLAQLQSDVPPAMVLGWFVSNCSEALIGAALVRRVIPWPRPLRFDSLHDAGTILLLAGVAGPFLSSFLDAALVRLVGWGEGDYVALVQMRFFSNLVAEITIVPLVLAVAALRPQQMRDAGPARHAEAAAVLAGMLLSTFAAYGTAWLDAARAPGLYYLPVPFLLWAALRLGAAGTAAAIGMLTFIAIRGAVHGHGPFAAASPVETARELQVFLVTVSVPLLLLAAVLEERIRASRDSLAQREQLTHLSRVKMLGDMSGGLAHELNQPLTAILSNAQAAQHLLANKTANDAELGDILGDIIAADRRAGEVIRRLRALFRRGETRFERLDPNDLLREVLSIARGDLVTRGVEIVLELQERLPAVQGDPVQLQQVMLNLLMNASEAMAQSASRDRILRVRTSSAGGEVHMSFIDRGTGFKPDLGEQLFEAFYTTKPQGLGLGLSISRSIVAAHGGRLWGVTIGGQGATFHLVLPALDAGP
jgi:signal transduction histidine kinase